MADEAVRTLFAYNFIIFTYFLPKLSLFVLLFVLALDYVLKSICLKTRGVETGPLSDINIIKVW